MTDGLVGVAWVARRLGLHRTTVQQAAAAGRIPAYRVLSDWRFSPAEIEGWLVANQNTQATEPVRAVEEPTRTASRPGRRAGGGASRAASNPPSRVVVFPQAPWRGVSDLPAEDEAGRAPRRRRGNKKAALRAN